MNAYIRVLIGIGPGLNKGQSHFPVPDAVSILTVVKKAESQAVFRQIRPFMGTYLKFGRIPAVAVSYTHLVTHAVNSIQAASRHTGDSA